MSLSVACCFCLSPSCWSRHGFLTTQNVCTTSTWTYSSDMCTHHFFCPSMHTFTSYHHLRLLPYPSILSFRRFVVRTSSSPLLPADEASTDGHLFTLVHHTGGLAGHHPVLVVPPGLAGSALHPGRRQRRGGRGGTVTQQFDRRIRHLPQPGWLLISHIYKESLGFEVLQQHIYMYIYTVYISM